MNKEKKKIMRERESNGLTAEGANVLEEKASRGKDSQKCPPGPMHARFRRRNRQDRVVNQR
ncbi:hypothetical protein GGI35DRAFT_457271 [Trichoderma velutinum]